MTKVPNDRYKISLKCQMLGTKVPNVNANYTIYYI